jgi:hypothetical protein
MVDYVDQWERRPGIVRPWWNIAKRMTHLFWDEDDNPRYSDGEPARGWITESSYLSASQLVTSHVGDGKHVLALDIDMPVVALPSSTPGHWHLIIDHEMSWEAYERVLDALRDAGILEEGLVSASKERRCTRLRTPWTFKGNQPMPVSRQYFQRAIRKLEDEKAKADVARQNQVSS